MLVSKDVSCGQLILNAGHTEHRQPLWADPCTCVVCQQLHSNHKHNKLLILTVSFPMFSGFSILNMVFMELCILPCYETGLQPLVYKDQGTAQVNSVVCWAWQITWIVRTLHTYMKAVYNTSCYAADSTCCARTKDLFVIHNSGQ